MISPDALDTECALSFLNEFDSKGWHNLVAIDPGEQAPPIGQTFAPGDTSGTADFIERWNGKRNLYFSVNEPRPNSHDSKLKKADIEFTRAVFADVDPRDGEPFDRTKAAFRSRKLRG